MSVTLTTVNPDATYDVDGTAGVLTDPTDIIVGGVTPANHAFLEFDLSAIADDDQFIYAQLTIKTSDVAAISVDLWAVEAGAAVANADYNVTATNATAFAVRIGQLIPSGALAETEHSLLIPSRFLNILAAVNSGLTHFELRPGSDWTSGAGNVASVHATDGADSPELAYALASETDLLQNDLRPYRSEAQTNEMFFAFDVETTQKVAVKGDIILDATDISISAYDETLQSNALSENRIKPIKTAFGVAGAGGSVAFELTPEKWWKLLLGIFKKTGTVDNGGGSYTHTFKVAQSDEIKTITGIKKVGNHRCVYPGTMISSLGLGASYGSQVTGNMSLQATEEWMYDDQGAGTDDEYLLTSTAGRDSFSNSFLIFSGVSIKFNSIQDTKRVRDFNISFDQSVNSKGVLNGSRFPSGQYSTVFTGQVGFTIYFENDREIRKLKGVNHKASPFRSGNCLEYDAVSFTMVGVCDNTVFTATISVPTMVYRIMSERPAANDAVMLELQADIVGSTEDAVVIAVTNSETDYVASTDYITVLPEGATYPS